MNDFKFFFKMPLFWAMMHDFKKYIIDVYYNSTNGDQMGDRVNLDVNIVYPELYNTSEECYNSRMIGFGFYGVITPQAPLRLMSATTKRRVDDGQGGDIYFEEFGKPIPISKEDRMNCGLNTDIFKIKNAKEYVDYFKSVVKNFINLTITTKKRPRPNISKKEQDFSHHLLQLVGNVLCYEKSVFIASGINKDDGNFINELYEHILTPENILPDYLIDLIKSNCSAPDEVFGSPEIPISSLHTSFKMINICDFISKKLIYNKKSSCSMVRVPYDIAKEMYLAFEPLMATYCRISIPNYVAEVFFENYKKFNIPELVLIEDIIEMLKREFNYSKNIS